jgi:putative flavoprotein involved in K+ transport
VVYTTGFDGVPPLALLAADIARKVGLVWGLGSRLRNMWRTVQTGLWFRSTGAGGSRFYSPLLALQIVARHAGLQTAVYRERAIVRADFRG